MIQTLKGMAKDHVILAKFILAVLITWSSGILVGTSAVRSVLRLNHPVLVAQLSPLAEEDHSRIAVHTEKLDQITRENQAGFDDRRQLHADVATLTDRLNVDEAQFKTVGWTFGSLFSIFGGISTLLAILEYRNKRRDRARP